MSWSHEQVELLIDLYKNKPCLYFVKSANYKNKHLRANALAEIEEGLKTIRPKTSINEIKSKINSFRTNFLSEYRKVKETTNKSGAGQDDVYSPTLWYFEQMLFIVEHSECRKQKDSLCINNESLTGAHHLEEDVITESQSDILLSSNPEDQTVYFDENLSAVIDEKDEGITEAERKSMDAAENRKVTKLRKRKATDSGENEILNEASKIMKTRSTALKDNTDTKSVIHSAKSNIDVFGDFVVSRLKMLTNDTILNEAMEEISLCLFNKYKQQQQ